MNNIEWNIADSLVEYPHAIQTMEQRVADIIAGNIEDHIWLLEHPPLYTSGTSANESDLLTPKRFPVYNAGRGGEYTYHGPGQRIAYTMLDLKKWHNGQQDLKRYISQLEEWIIQTLQAFGVKGERREGRVGIWVVRDNGREEKIAAIGVRVRKWVTFHGLAINVTPDLSHFTGIVPCGISEHGVCSLESLGVNVNMEEVDQVLKNTFQSVFG